MNVAILEQSPVRQRAGRTAALDHTRGLWFDSHGVPVHLSDELNGCSAMHPSLVAMLSGGHLQGVGERQAREASSGEVPRRNTEHASDELEEPTEELKAQGHPAIGAHHREVCVDVPVDDHRRLGERLLLLLFGTDGRQAIQALLELPNNVRGQEAALRDCTKESAHAVESANGA